MTDIERVNGNRPSGLLNLLDPSLKSAPRPQQDDVSFDLETGLSSIVRLSSKVSEDAFSARTLGTEREGNAIFLGNDGIFITIGYLVVDAYSISLHVKGETNIQAEIVGYNHESGLALIHALSPPDIPVIEQGSSENLEANEDVIIAPYGGLEHSISGKVVSRREFAGSWEYLLDRAIFTTPIHPNWSGAALIRLDGTLCGIGSLWINDAAEGPTDSPGNMFVPIELLHPIYEDLISNGLVTGPHRPWLGMYTSEAMKYLFISGVIPDAPAAKAGLEPGDQIMGINDESVSSLGNMYKTLWALGDAGITVTLNVVRDGEELDIAVISDSRYSFVSKRSNH